jgi:hypothetical protein
MSALGASIIADLSHGLLAPIPYVPPPTPPPTPLIPGQANRQAPNLETLLDLQSAIEPRLRTLLDQIVRTFAPRSGETLTGNRIDVTLAKGPWAGRWGLRTNGLFCESCWRYSLTLALFTTLVTKENPVDIHPRLRAQIRPAIIAAVADPGFLSYHTIASLHEQSGTETITTAEDLNCSAIIYTGLVTIRSDAYPPE